MAPKRIGPETTPTFFNFEAPDGPDIVDF